MIKRLFIFLTSFVLFLFIGNASFASTFSLSPSGGTIPSGSTLSVSVRLNTQGESINAFAAYLSYPADKLEVASISYGGSFSLAAEGTYGGGAIRISRGSISGASGNLTVATIGFRGKSQGTATVSFVGGSAAARTSDSSDSLNLGGSTGGVFTIGAAKQGTTTSVKVTGTPAPAQPQDTTKPVISNLKVSEIATNAALITWQTDEKADSTVEYGLNESKYFLMVTDKNLTTTHSLNLQADALTPGSTLHFIVKSKDEAGNEAMGNDQIIQLKGYTVNLKVIDTNNMPIKDVEVTLYTEPLKSRTNQQGEAIFYNVIPGKHLAVVRINNSNKTGEVMVEDSPLPQTLYLIIDTKGSSSPIAYLVSFVVIVVTIAVLLGVLIKLRKKTESPQIPPTAPPQQTPL